MLIARAAVVFLLLAAAAGLAQPGEVRVTHTPPRSIGPLYHYDSSRSVYAGTYTNPYELYYYWYPYGTLYPAPFPYYPRFYYPYPAYPFY